MMKYINTKRHGMIVFPLSIPHREMAIGLGVCPKMGCVSAGFVQTDFEGEELYVECFGESESLRLASHPKEDTELLKQQLSPR